MTVEAELTREELLEELVTRKAMAYVNNALADEFVDLFGGVTFNPQDTDRLLRVYTNLSYDETRQEQLLVELFPDDTEEASAALDEVQRQGHAVAASFFARLIRPTSTEKFRARAEHWAMAAALLPADSPPSD